MLRVVADLGNTRLKWGRLDAAGRLAEVIALPLDDPSAWAAAWSAWRPEAGDSWWAVSTVNPPVSDRLEAFFEAQGIDRVTLDPIRGGGPGPEGRGGCRQRRVRPGAGGLRGGADHPAGPPRPGGDVRDGDHRRADHGGGHLAGRRDRARARPDRAALNLMTAQLPFIELSHTPPAWGRGTVDSLKAGIFWGIVGAVRELLTRQEADLGIDPWVVWTGGDAELLAPQIFGAEARIEPNLILDAVATVAFGRCGDPRD